MKTWLDNIIYRTNIERRRFKCLAERKENVINSRHTSERKSLEKIDIKRNKFLLIISLFLIISAVSHSDSFWTQDFNGYIYGNSNIGIGEIIFISINTDFSLSFNSSSKDDKSITLEFSGGEYGDLLSFLPVVKSGGNNTIKGDEEHTLNTALVARVTRISDDGYLYIQGNRSILLDGKEETLAITGWINPVDLSREREISFSKIAESRLTFQSFLRPGADILTSMDITAIISDISEENDGSSASISLSEEKKQELFLIYVNRLVDIIFQ